MERLDQLSTYFKEKERRKLSESISDKNGLPEMSLAEIRLSCLENNGYETPELNDKLYLHFRGYKKIENLDAYVNCKAIWLDSNGFETIEGLDHMIELRCLYLSKNLISNIQGLENLSNLVLLDLSNNRLSKFEGLHCCPNLQTLNISRNALTTAESIEHLQYCSELANLDLTNNNIEANDNVIDVLKNIPKLVNLSINGNEITKLPSFRKKMITTITKLCYLDRPIEELERIAAVAYMSGGQEAEKQARDSYRDAKNQQRIREHEEYRRWQKEQFAIREKNRLEGRSYMVEMTQAQIDERNEDRERTAREEQLVLQEGIDKLAKKYWSLDASSDSRSDILQQASNEILSEREERIVQQEAIQLQDVTLSESSETMTVTETEIETETKISPSKDTSTIKEVASSPDVGVNNTTGGLSADNSKKEENLLEIEEQRRQQQLAMKEKQREDDARQQLVAESLAIFRQQIADKNNKVPPTQHHPEPTWTNASQLASDIDPEEKVASGLYWSESMDIALAKGTRSCVFDFDRVAEVMKAQAQSGQFGLLAKGSTHMIDAEACRLRWAQLDAENWCELDPESMDDDVVYKVCIQPEVLGKGHGAQPSFQSLRAIAAGSMPSYLKPPSYFPSVADADSDDEGDDEQKEISPVNIVSRARNLNFKSSNPTEFETLD